MGVISLPLILILPFSQILLLQRKKSKFIQIVFVRSSPCSTLFFFLSTMKLESDSSHNLEVAWLVYSIHCHRLHSHIVPLSHGRIAGMPSHAGLRSNSIVSLIHFRFLFPGSWNYEFLIRLQCTLPVLTLWYVHVLKLPFIRDIHIIFIGSVCLERLIIEFVWALVPRG